MKKIITLIAILAIASTVSADIVNGDFSAAMGSTADNKITTDAEKDSWRGQNNSWSIVSGKAVRDFTSRTGTPDGMAQVFNYDGMSGNYYLQLDYEFSTTDSNGYMPMRIYQGIGPGPLNWGCGFNVSGEAPGNNANYTWTLLVATNLPRQSATAFKVPFAPTVTLDSTDIIGISFNGYDMYDDPNTVMTVDNVSIQPIPEPAALGLLALGIIAFIRRK